MRVLYQLICLVAFWAFVLKADLVPSDNFDKLQAFTKWFTKNKGIINGIEVHQFPGMGNGFIATKTIEENDLVLKVPNQLIFCSENMKDHPSALVRWFYDYFNTQSSENALVAWLLYEKYLGEGSSFFEYIQVLPTNVPNLLYFSDDEVAELQNKVYEEEILSYQQEVQQNYRAFVRGLHQLLVDKQRQIPASLGELFLPPNFVHHPEDEVGDRFTASFGVEDVAQRVTMDEYRWALSIFNSRALRFHGEIHLIPMSDIFNYEKHSKPRATDNGNFFLQFHQRDASGAVSIFADRPTEQGRQLFEDYGDNTNEIYLQYHGFIPHQLNPFHCVKAEFGPFFRQLADLPEDSPLDVAAALEGALAPKQLELLKAFAFPLRQMQAVCLKQDGRIGRNFVVFFSLLSAKEEEVAVCLASWREQTGGPTGNKQRINWMKIFRDCGFEERQQFLERHLADAAQALAQDRPVPDPFPEDQTEDEDELDDSADARFWRTFRSFLRAALSAQRFPTRAEEDRAQLLSIQQWWRGYLPGEGEGEVSPETVTHRELAVKYRVTNKLLLQHLAALYGLDPALIYAPAASSSSSEMRADGATTRSVSGSAGEAVGMFEESAARAKELLPRRIADFNDWFRSYGPRPCKIEAVLFDNFYRVGTAVTADTIARDELYLGVPQAAIMSAERAFQSPGIQSLVSGLLAKYGRNDEFHELVFFLLHEALVRGVESEFYPYLVLLPRPADQRDVLPVYWSPELIRRRLSPSHLAVEVLNYQRRVQRRFQFLQNITEITSFFTVRQAAAEKGGTSRTTQLFSYEHYLWATAILDSRAIWWEGKRHLVPMLDFINCAEHPSDPARVHSTTLDDSKRFAVTRSGNPTPKS